MSPTMTDLSAPSASSMKAAREWLAEQRAAMTARLYGGMDESLALLLDRAKQEEREACANIKPAQNDLDAIASWYEANVAGPIFGTPSAVALKRKHIRNAALDFAAKISSAFPGILHGGPESFDYFQEREALREIVNLLAEKDAITGGGPGFGKRWKLAMERAGNLVGDEP